MDVSILKKVLPDVDFADPEIRKMAHSNAAHEMKVMNILKYYFNRKKTNNIESQSPQEEAYYIKKLLPSLPFLYILKQLEMFKDMPNRKEIVLRIIVSSKMHDGGLIPDVKRPPSNVQPADQSCDYYCAPVKIRKLTTGIVPVCKVIHTNDKSRIPKPLIMEKMILLNSHVNNYTPGVIRNSEQQEETLISNVPKVNTSLSPLRYEQDFQEAVKQEETDTNSKFSQDHLYFKGQLGTSRIEILGPKIVGEDEQPVAEAFTISSSTLEPKEDLDVINDYIKEKMEQDQQDKPSNYLSNQPVADESALPVARNYTVTSNVSEVNSMDQPKQTFNWNLLNVNPTMLHVNPHDYVSQFPLGTLADSTELKKSRLDNAINGESSPKTNGKEVSNKRQTVPFTTLECKDQNVAPVVSSSSIKCIPQNEPLGHTTITDGGDLQEQCQSHQVDVPSTSNEQSIDMSENSGNFNLIECLYDITNAPLNIIRRECRKLKLPTATRPDPVLLQLVIDNLLTNKISSGSSNDEDEPEMVETTPIEDVIQHLNKIRKLRSAQNPQPNVVPSGIQPKAVKTIASATITSQSQLDQTVSNETQKAITSVALDLTSPPNVATAENLSSSVNVQLVTYLCGIFPDAAPEYIRGLCKNKPMSNEILDDLTTVILSTNGTYPKRPPVVAEPDVFPENQLDILKEFLPDADPDYLRMMCDKFEGKPDMVKSFINEAMERRNYPTMKDYQRRQQLSAQQKQYTTEFSVENFIKLIPDPHVFFADSQRTIKMDSLSAHYALVFLRNTFNKLSVRIIQSTFTKNNCRLYKTVKELQQAMTQKHLIMKSTRKPIVMPNGIQNIPLLQEVAYFSHEKEINEYLQEIKDKEDAERKEASSKGLLKTCSCCYDEEVLPKDIFCCEKGCSFCKFCIIKSTEVRFGEGKLDFPCLMNCSSHFTLQTLQAALSPKLFSKIAQKKALDEIKSAGIEELEMCPFCDFATIPAEGYNIFSCLNPECMKESCRLCKEPSHIPLRCEEIEKDEDVKARTFVENKMTEALLRKCWKCGIKFFKEEGCNKMTCSCGAQMCYICGSRVTDYKHFNGNGGDRLDLCPLYSDTNVLNKENVLRGAAEAKAEIGNKELKHDPTNDVQQHFKERAAKVPQQYIPQGHNDQRQRVEAAVFLGVREAIDRLEHRFPQFPF